MPLAGATPWIALAALAAALAAVQTARLWWGRASKAWILQERVARARRGEERAEALLAGAGYEVLARQIAGRWTLRADGAPIAVDVRADLLVARDGRRYVAEVKTGQLAPRVDHLATRRQLLEYLVAFDVDGVILVDAESERIVHVAIDERDAPPPRPASSGALFVFACGALAGAALALALAR